MIRVFRLSTDLCVQVGAESRMMIGLMNERQSVGGRHCWDWQIILTRPPRHFIAQAEDALKFPKRHYHFLLGEKEKQVEGTFFWEVGELMGDRMTMVFELPIGKFSFIIEGVAFARLLHVLKEFWNNYPE